ncbi:zinc finger BED domain-containing protein 1-like protein [Aphelenchoides avenae]|nr:zinc finger BED domain-containing protein 1-like protein [Aphelenchus avenae]
MIRRFGSFINANHLSFNPHYVMAAVFDPSQAFLVDLDSDFICRLIADRMKNEDASEAVSDAEPAGADDDDYEEMMLKKRKLEKRLSSQDRTAGHGSGSLTEAKECINAVLYQDFRATEPLEWWRSEGSVKYPNVHPVALKYLAAPATSASVERCFSHAGLAVVGKKNRTQESLLDDKLMYHLNENISR